jgi:hypothetical protein
MFAQTSGPGILGREPYPKGRQMETLLDVLRALADGLLRVGGIGQEAHQAIHDVINEHDEEHQAEASRAARFSDADAAELERLQAKQAAAEPGPADPVPASPLLGGGIAE